VKHSRLNDWLAVTMAKGQQMQQKPKFIVLEKKETWLQSIVSDLFTYALAFLLVFVSWLLSQTIWTIVGVGIFFISLSLGACESKATKLKTKEEAIRWANSLDDDC